MSSPYQPSPLKSSLATNDAQLKKRIDYLTLEMKEIDLNHDDYISREELFQYLDRKAQREFDRNIANEIFEHMDKDHNGRITIDEFIRVYLEADEILRRKIETAKQNREYYRRQHEENLKKSEESKATERVNSYGVMEGSFVHVTIVAARDLRSGLTGLVDPFVDITLDGTQSLKTKVVNSNSNPSWNEKFTFEVTNAGSHLKFTVMDYGGITRGSFVGEAQVALSELREQTIQDVWLDLYEKNGVRTQGQLNVKLHWIHSKVKYYALAAEKWRETYLKEQEELDEYQKYLANLWDPFQGMSQFKGHYEQQPRGSVKSESALGSFDKKFYATVHNFTSKFTPDPANENLWLRIATYACITTVILSFLMSFQRTVFFELIYAIGVILHIQRNFFNDFANWRYLSIAVGLSILAIDIPFITIYPGNWNGNTWIIDGDLFNHVRGFVDVVSYIHLIVKIFEVVIFYIIYIQQKRASNPRVSIRKMNLAAT